MSRWIIVGMVSVYFLVAGVGTVSAEEVKLNSSSWLGNLKLEDGQLIAIKKAMEKALNAPIDASQQCGEVRQDCVVRAAREWTIGKDRFRELVVYIHTVGQASNVVAQTNGVWPTISAK
ncbi:MAG: hypothetical protein GXP14_00485 [Gammaproteobacteria bacterium]|nr:hypothetical protein [Gammaproteobacteria bacterium]